MLGTCHLELFALRGLSLAVYQEDGDGTSCAALRPECRFKGRCVCDVEILRIALNGVLHSRRSGRRNGSCCGVVWGEGGNGAVG